MLAAIPVCPELGAADLQAGVQHPFPVGDQHRAVVRTLAISNLRIIGMHACLCMHHAACLDMHAG